MIPLHYRWGHAINSRALLATVQEEIQCAEKQQFATSNVVNAIEADVIWDKEQQTPVMGHPPAMNGDLTFVDFLQTMLDIAGSMTSHDDTPFIVKCDFKSQQAFEASLDLLATFVAQYPFTRSVFVNADILPGPESLGDVAFDAATFLKHFDDLGAIDNGKHRHKLVLSVGWTTVNGKDQDVYDNKYSHDMVDAMLRQLQPYGDRFVVTFPLRATSVRHSWPALRQLLEQPNYGFTLWWALTQMSDADLEWMYKTLELDIHEEEPTATRQSYAGRTFYDIKGFSRFLARRK
uniref:Menorin-like domain-containing protein n=1 Tax=Peronospora matthiolae TaxID=2874970 RepID=A0AAV1U4Q4_9STRA